MTGTTLVFGASSYVGGYVVGALLAAGSRVVGVSRRPEIARMLLPGESDRFVVSEPRAALDKVTGELTGVVNLGYVKGSAPHRLHTENRKLVRTVTEAAASGGAERLIHISTAAVFGYAFSEEPAPVRVRRPPMDLYAESKLHAEHLVENFGAEPPCEVAIVRLGNVLGAGSPIWTAGLAQQIIEGIPLGYRGRDGHSNATHVANVADYVVHLLSAPAGKLAEFGPYHHLAEFSSNRWSELLDPLSQTIGVRWTRTISSQPRGSGGPLPKRAFKAAYRTRLGHRIRTVYGRLPDSRAVDRLASGLRMPGPPALRADDGLVEPDANLLAVLSAEHEFTSFTVPGWQPKVDFAEARREILEWVAASGYRLRDPPG